jgi:DnaK suppressor protein
MRHDAIHQWLDELERQSRVTVAASEEELATLGHPETGEWENDATRVLAIGVLDELVAREWSELEEIAAARGRLAEGTFGWCEGCGRDIGHARLRAVPTARHCVRCQAELERGPAAWAAAA